MHWVVNDTFNPPQEPSMSQTLTDHDAIREWAVARAGNPAVQDVPTGTGETDQALRLVFGQRGARENDDNTATESLTLIEWDEWFRLFEEKKLALIVADDVPGELDQYHDLLAR